MIGQTISHYKILEKLGEGGMGVVYKAEDTKLKRLVALKFLHANTLGGAEEKSRFLREAQAAAALNHSNICTIHDVDEVDGQMFIAMEHIEGQSLREKIKTGPLQIEEAIKFVMQVAEGLQAAHEKGITHRDIKSANIMITNKNQAKIMDFGLAKLAAQKTRLTKTGMTIGTVAYMSPEQAQGIDADHRSDIWSLGVVLYEMITGQLPFRGEYEQAMMYSILNEDPQPMTGLRTGVPMELERIVNKAMAKKMDERYQHVDELLVDLKTLGRRLEFGGATERAQINKSAPFPHAKVKPQSLAIMIGGAILIAGIVAALFMVDGKQNSNLHPNRIVVAVFDNQTGDPSLDPVGRMAADWITQGLAQTGLVEIVPSLSALPASDDAGAASGTRTDIAFVRTLANATGAGKVIFGTYYRQGESIQFQAQIMDAQHEKLLSAITPVSGSLKNPMEAVERLRQNVMGAVATYVDSRLRSEGAIISRHHPPNFEAYQEFIEGMQLFVRREFAEAVRHLARAYAFDTTFTNPLGRRPMPMEI
ncbi:MAG: serine/threonine protein kinase [bacterium]